MSHNGNHLTRESVRQALSRIIDPDLGRDIVSLGFVKDVELSNGRVSVTIELTTPACPVKDQMKAEAEQYLRELGAEHVEVNMTGGYDPTSTPADSALVRAQAAVYRRGGIDPIMMPRLAGSPETLLPSPARIPARGTPMRWDR